MAWNPDLESNTGLLFAVQNKKTDRSPDWTGKVCVGNRDYDITAYTRISKKTGKEFLALKFIEPIRKDEEAAERDGLLD